MSGNGWSAKCSRCGEVVVIPEGTPTNAPLEGREVRLVRRRFAVGPATVCVIGCPTQECIEARETLKWAKKD